MKGFLIGMASLTLLTALGASQATAQTDANKSLSSKGTTSAPVEQTPEMWFYQKEMERYDSPKEAVRRNAQFVSQQRRMRMAARKWYGLSNSRPTVNPTPWMGTYSPTWVSGRMNSYGWPRRARGTTVVIAR